MLYSVRQRSTVGIADIAHYAVNIEDDNRFE
jgi:hypothetical protein